MRRVLYSTVFIFVFSLLSFAQQQQQQPSPNKILSRAAKAHGGEKALQAVRARTSAGKITRLADGASGAYRADSLETNLFAENFDLNGFEIAAGFNGKSGWARDSRDGLRTLTGEASRNFQAEAAFRQRLWLDYKKDKSKIAPLVARSATSVNNRPTHGVLLTTAKGVQIKMFFDAESGRLARAEIPAENDSDAAAKTFDYGDYRPVGNVFEPFQIKTTVGGEIYEIRLDEIKHNPSGIARTVFDFPKISDEPLPDIKTLLEEIRANADRVDQILENYSYTATRVEREIDRAGNLVEKDSETVSFSFYKGYRIRRLTAKNGRPLSAGEQDAEDKKAEKQAREIEEKIARKEKKQEEQKRDIAAGKAGNPDDGGGEGGEGQRISLSDALRGSLLVNPRRERLRGRDVIVFDYEPNPEFKPKTRIERVFALCTGAVWVDAADKQVVRLEASLTKSAGNFLAKLKRGASFTIENERINNEIWLPSVADVNLSVKILFAGINVNNLIKYGDYKRFETEVKDGKVNDIQP